MSTEIDARTQAIKDRMAKRSQQQRGRMGGTSFFKFRECKQTTDKGNLVRFLFPPNLSEEDHDPLLHYQKYSVPMQGYQYGLDVVASAFFGLDDPIKVWQESLLEAGRDEEAKELGPKDEYLGMLIDVETVEGLCAGVQVARMGPQVSTEILDCFANDQYGIVWDIEKGTNIRVRGYDDKGFRKYKADLDRYDSSLQDNIDRLQKAHPEAQLPTVAELLAQARQIDLRKYIKVEADETLLEIIEGQYDKDAAAELRAIRDKTQGNPVTRFYCGVDSPNPAEGGPGSRDSTKSTRQPAVGGSTEKAAPAKTAGKTLNRTTTAAPLQTAAGTTQKTSHGNRPQRESAAGPADNLESYVGKTILYTSKGQQVQGVVTSIDRPPGMAPGLVVEREGHVPVVVEVEANKVQIVEEEPEPEEAEDGDSQRENEQPVPEEPVTEEKQQSYKDRIRSMANQ